MYTLYAIQAINTIKTLRASDCFSFLLVSKDSARFLCHLNILLGYRLFGNVHFFGVRSPFRNSAPIA
jgi:hypothetical protein